MPHKTVSAEIKNLTALLEFVDAQAVAAGFEPRLCNQIKLAFEEAVVNVINYAYPGPERGSVDVDISFDGKALRIVIEDSGIAFDPLAMPEPDITAPLEERKIGGLGVYMFRQIMDEVSYKRESGRNILTLVKYR